MKRNADGSVDWSGTAASEVDRGLQRQAELQLTPSERAMLAKRRERDRKRAARKAARNQADRERRADYLIDPSVIDWAAKMSEWLDCSESQVVEFAVRYLAGAVQNGAVDLSTYCTPSPTPQRRYSQILSYPQISKLSPPRGDNYTVSKSVLHSTDSHYYTVRKTNTTQHD